VNESSDSWHPNHPLFGATTEVLLRGLCLQGDHYPEALSHEEFLEVKKSPERYPVLMTCRPKTDFHLGNLWMFNKIRQFLASGFPVHIAVITFDEELAVGSPEYIQLGETANSTKRFLQDYLDAHPALRVWTSQELHLDQDSLRRNHQTWIDLLTHRHAEDESLNELDVVDVLFKQRGNFWASAQHTFVAKCVAVYEKLAPQITICGEKHRWTTLAFRAVARELGVHFPAVVYLENLRDLGGEMDMDGTRSGHRVVTVRDSEEKITFKLSLIDSENFREWSDAALEKVVLARGDYELYNQPIWLLEDFQKIFRTDTEFYNGIFLRELVKALRGAAQVLAVPALELAGIARKPPSTVGRALARRRDRPVVRWSEGIEWHSRESRELAEKLMNASFLQEKYGKILVRQEFSGGYGGSRVFEVVLFDESRRQAVGSEVIKIGSLDQLQREKANYDRFVAPQRSFAFTEVTGLTSEIDGKVGLTYANAKPWLGLSVTDTIDPFESVCKADFQNGSSIASEMIEQLVLDHLGRHLYRYGEFYELRRYREFYERKLPAGFLIEVPAREADEVARWEGTDPRRPVPTGSGSWRTGDSVELSSWPVLWLDERRARLASPEDAREVEVRFEDAELLRQLRARRALGTGLSVQGRVVESRQETLRRAVSRSLDYTHEGELRIGGRTWRSPEIDLERLLNREYRTARLSVIHGDLNLRNILVGDGKSVVIDYQYTEPNQLTSFDFVKLELDYRLKVLATELEPRDFMRLDRSLIRGRLESDDLAVPFGFISTVRKLAARYLEQRAVSDYDWEDYHLGLYFYGLGLLKFSTLTDYERRAAVLTAVLYQDGGQTLRAE